jgi:hypothetical protein
MMMKDYNIKAATALIPNIDIGFVTSLLSDVFGINSPIYLPYSSKNDFKAKGYSIPEQYIGFETIDGEEEDRLSVFGTPVMGSFTIAGGTYKVYDKRSGALINKEGFDDFEFPVATIVEFRKPKVINKTSMSGGAGRVKEVFGMDDWTISIKGLCLDDPSRKSGSRSAKEQQQRLIELNEIAGSLEILRGSIFTEKKIERIVIEELGFSPIQGKPNIIPFEISACSDEDILLYS